MRSLSETFTVAERGRVLAERGTVAKTCAAGLPALLRFALPAGSTAFAPEPPDGQTVTQDLAEGLDRPA